MPLKIRPNAIEQDQGDFIFPGVISEVGQGQFKFDADLVTGSAGIEDRNTATTFLQPVHVRGSVLQFAANDLVPVVRYEQGQAIFNPTAAAKDLRVHSEMVADAFFVQATGGYVGLGTNTPSRKLELFDDEDLFLRIAPGATARAAQVEYVRGSSFTWLGPTSGDEFHLWSQENFNFVMGLNNGEVLRATPTGIHVNDADGPIAFAHWADDGEFIQFNDPTYNKIIAGDNRSYWTETVPSKLYGHVSVVADNVAAYPSLVMEKYNDTGYYPTIQTRVARGTLDNPTAITNGNQLLNFTMNGHDGWTYRNVAGVAWSADGNWSSGTYPVRFNMTLSPGSSTNHSIMFHQWQATGVPAGTTFNAGGAENQDFTIFASGSSGGNPTNPAFKVICGTGEVQFDTSGLTIPSSVTGGDKGQGTINVTTDIYKANSAYTNPDYVLEHYYRGEIIQFAGNPGAGEYQGLMPLPEVDAFMNENLHLPQIARGTMGAFDRADALLLHLEQVYLYLIEQEKRLRDLEKQYGNGKDFQ